jgi:hypothetical protein
VSDVPQFILDRALAKEPIFTADEVAAWPNGMLDQLTDEGILAATDNAQSVVCDACGHDHVETVEYVSAPPGTALRAYIFCDENGRVRVPLDRLRRWVVHRTILVKSGLIAPDTTDTRAHRSDHTAKPKRSDGKQAPKRSWTQVDLDEAIRKYKSQRASAYRDLVNGVKQGLPGAIKSARDLFGRNVIMRALGVKSAAMVSKSLVWQAIADDLQLRRPAQSAPRRPKQRMGLDMAMEDQAQATGTSILGQVVEQEAIRLIKNAMPAAMADATIEKLRRGDITDDDARELVAVFQQQQSDQQTHTVRQTP